MNAMVTSCVGRSLVSFVIIALLAQFAGQSFAAEGVYNTAVVQASSTRFWHPHKISSIKFSPDGRSILSITGGERFQWETKTGELQERKKLQLLRGLGC